MENKKRECTSITYQAGKGFKECIGTHVGRDGTINPRIWWLGSDERAARAAAERVLEVLTEPGMARGNLWTPKASMLLNMQSD